jgi:hypothetical protein
MDVMRSDEMDPDFFRATPLANPDKMRPLGTLSDIVVEVLPSVLREVRAGHVASSALNALIDGADTAAAWRDLPAAERPLACLDLMILRHACDHAGAELPAAIAGEAEALCRSLGRIDAFLYEDCVLSNPLDRDPRVFADGRTAFAERDFLWVHQRIETCLLRAIECIDEIVLASHAPAGWRGDYLSDALAQHEMPLRRSLSRIDGLFAAMRAMCPMDFRSFRDYYMPSPRSGRPGPSGRFSAKFFALRLLVEGDAVGRQQPELLQEIVRMSEYFPSADRAVLLARLGPRACLRQQAHQPWAQGTAAPALLALARQVLDRCTAVHLGLVRKYVAGRDDDAKRVA